LIKKVGFVEQNEHSECGLASVTMILNYYKDKISLSELRDIYGVPKGGNTLTHLKIILQDHGIETKAVRVSDVSLFLNMDSPSICHWDNKHYVVLEQMNRRHAVILDPANGRMKISIEEFLEHFSGVSLIISDINAEKRSHKGNAAVDILKEILKSQKWQLLVFIIMTLLSQVVTIFVPMATQSLIDGANLIKNSVFFILFLALLFMAGHYILQVVRGMIIIKFQKFFDLKIMREFMNKIMKLSLRFFVNRSTGDLIFRANISTIIQQMLSQRLLTIAMDLIFLFVYLFLMLQYSVWLTIIALAATLIMGLVSVFNSKKAQSITDKELIVQSRVQRILVELFEGIETIKSLGAEKQFYNNWDENFNQQVELGNEKSRYMTWIGGVPVSIQFILPLILVTFGLQQESIGAMSLGQVIGFNIIMGSFIGPVVTIFDSYTEILMLKSYFGKLNEILETKVNDTANEEAKKLEVINSVEVKDVFFKYSHFEEEVLKGVSLKIKKGEKVAIVGKSGSGKSTLIKLIANLYELEQGEVLFNDSSLKKLDAETLKRQVSIVNQSPSIFNTSVLDNIVMKNDDITEERLRQVISDAKVDEIIDDLPLGLETQISEGGMNLSGGQKQRISIARALARNPQLLLMDEPTSSLDNISENHIMNRLKEYDFMCVVVAHRLNTVKHFDRIIVLENGRIMEQGKHEELMKLRGLYFNIYSEDS
jgi:ABC-type bacteriocin/lantibiotic exporter with double-glycine peptidase domain